MRAFPTDIYYDEQRIGQHDGMQLRDYFAAKIACGYLAASAVHHWTDYDEFASEVYGIADAMMRQRSTKKARA